MISDLTWNYFVTNVNVGRRVFALPYILNANQQLFSLHPHGRSKMMFLIFWLVFYVGYVVYGVHSDLHLLHTDPELTGDTIFRSVIITIQLIVLVLLLSLVIWPTDLIEYVNAWINMYREYGGNPPDNEHLFYSFLSIE